MTNDELKTFFHEIFDVDKIIIEAFQLGKEQEALFVEVLTTNRTFHSSGDNEKIQGIVSYCSTTDIEKFIYQIKKLKKSNISFNVSEIGNINYNFNNGNFNKVRIPFTLFNKIANEEDLPITENLTIEVQNG